MAVTTTNGCGQAVGHMSVAVCEPVLTVAITGPTRLRVREAGLFAAFYTPVTATLPVTLTWDSGTRGATAVYSWTRPGLYTLTVIAANSCGSASSSFAVTVDDYGVYFPLVVRLTRE